MSKMKNYIFTLFLFMGVCKSGGFVPLIPQGELESIAQNASISCKKYIDIETKNDKTTYKQKGMELFVGLKSSRKNFMRDKLAFLGLSKCFGVSFDTLQRQDSTSVLTAQLCQLTHYNFDGSLQDITDFVTKARESQAKDYEPSRLAEVCLEMYDSKQYNAEVERIIKKYCKECE